MGRLFDVGEERTKAEDAKRRRDEVRQRAAEVDRILQEEGFLNQTADKVTEALSSQKEQASLSVEAIRYASFRKPGSKWLIEHAKVGDDYVFQLFPLKPPTLVWQDVVATFIAVMDVIYPRSVEIFYARPDEQFQVKFYTIRVANVIGLPGWETACKERALNGLAAADVWARPA